MSYVTETGRNSPQVNYQDLYLYGSDAVLVIDEKRRVLALNPAAEAITGWQESEVAGKKECSKVFGCHGRDGVRLCRTACPGIEAMRTSVPVEHVECRITTRQGVHLDVEASFSPVPVAAASAAAIFVRGVAGSNRRNESFAQWAAEQELEKLKAQFLARVSHELRTPLTTMMAGSQLLARKELPAGKVQEIATMIEQQAKGMSKLVESLLELSRMVAGECAIKRTSVGVPALLRDMAGQFEAASPLHRLVVDCPVNLPRAAADRSRIRDVLEILLDNAIRYSPDGGTVTLAAERRRDLVCISVADEGVGIPRQNFGSVFSPFYRVEGAVSKKVKGAGVGLALCKYVVEMHGGRIWLDSEVGEGSVFYFTLPVARPGFAGMPEASH
ncbi:MAG: ATP-binding protein [Chloroflexi bacterium]|nr:ATP-binding protein [Chloroflexota bacterium]